MACWLKVAFASFISLAPLTSAESQDIKNQTTILENPNLKTFLANQNMLALQMFSLISETQNTFVYSPYALSLSFGLVYPGAESSTQSQMSRLLRFLRPQPLLGVFQELSTFLASKPQSSIDDLLLNFSASLWIQRGKPLTPAYEQILGKLKVNVKQTDFLLRSEQSRIEINNWARENSQNKSTDLITSGELNKDVKIVLASTASMRGKWTRPFDTSLTKQIPFFPDPSITATVPMMTIRGDFPHYNNKLYSIVELPLDLKKLKTMQVSMYIIVPRDTYGLADVEKSLKADKLVEALTAMQQKNLLVTIPKFKILNSISFKEKFEKLGLTDPFSTYADFSGINEEQNLKLSKVLQKASIEIDEKGFGAGIPMASRDTKADPIIPELFLADHPFMFLIMEKTTGLILFMGKVSEP